MSYHYGTVTPLGQVLDLWTSRHPMIAVYAANAAINNMFTSFSTLSYSVIVSLSM